MKFCIVPHGDILYEEALALRYLVMRQPLGLSFTPEEVHEDIRDTHIVGLDENGKVLACAILTWLAPNVAKMRQVVIAPELQGKGYGTSLVKYFEELVKEEGAEKIVLHARETAVPFYLKLGYQVVGDPFVEVTIPHFRMEKTIQ